MFGWVIGANIFVLTTVSLVFVLLPWLAGHQPKLDGRTIALAGATGLALMVGFIFLAFRRHQNKTIGVPSASLRLDAAHARLTPRGGTERVCAREDFVARPVHAHETLRGVDYYMGPALELQIGEEQWVIATMDGKRRWAYDPPAVQKIDWIVASDAWATLLAAEDLVDDLVAYEGQQ